MTAYELAAGRHRTFRGQHMTPRPDVERLMSRVALGDEGAYAQLYDRLAPTVFGVALRVLRDRARAEEVAQEVMVRIWQIAPRFDAGRGSVKAWAATMAHRRAVDVVRSVEASRRREQTDGRQQLVVPFDEAAETTEIAEDRRKVQKAMGELTELQRQAVVLTYFDGLTYRQAAELLDTPLATMKTRMRDALLKLRATLGVDHE